MGSITRRNFIARVGTLSAAAALRGAKQGEASSTAYWPGGEVRNHTFSLSLSPRDGLRNTRLVHIPSGLRLAAGDYSYSFGRPKFRGSSILHGADGSITVSLQGTAIEGWLEVLHEFHLPAERPWVEEQIMLTNHGTSPLDISSGRCGFVLPISISERQATGEWGDFKLTAIPYRREPNGYRRQYADFSLGQLLTEVYSSELWTQETTVTPAYASEGWACTDGKRSFLLTKYSQEGMEWSLLDRIPAAGGLSGLRWGGYGIYRGNPEHGAWLLPDESHRFGITRLTAHEGGMVEGFYAFREEMSARGHGCPADYDPPVHWNELYDNKLWWLGGDEQNKPAMRKKYYSLADMKEEAAKAKTIGCEALYMDPGWDTNFASKIWDTARLGPYPAFTRMLRQEYGLKSALHTPLSGWCDPTSYPNEMYRMNRFGDRLTWNLKQGFTASPLCGASKQYLEETARRLKVLAKGGAAYFMFDGTMYHAECWDPNHGHVVPARQAEHVQGTCRLARMVHAEYPHVLIEMHDPMAGGYPWRYAPTYYGHGHAPEGEGYAQALGFDSIWGFELMWNPMENLVRGKSIALYYYNLAYALPIYLHIDLRTDNRNALSFWWYASTCRHLGIGGTSKDPAINKAHFEAMATYRKLEPFFKRGKFYGIDEQVHVHVHPSDPAAVINAFNLDSRPAKKQIEFIPGKYGLEWKRRFHIVGARSRRTQEGYALFFDIPALGHQLAEIRLG
jgi:hypothetical protein